ncbi:hypothetical protein [Pedobacter nutrimenti]|uniref:hypothetical protein n=1 Tax=Pedobacter nutrimenti TaxID=1241337 RepID=UPI00292F6EF3|nr:hypothetical protein [Pedobacter nutrimenti]
MHLNLKGKAWLEDNDSDAYVEFDMECAGGGLFVSGQVGVLMKIILSGSSLEQIRPVYHSL